MRFTSCIPALDMLTVQLDPLSKPVGPVFSKIGHFRRNTFGKSLQKVGFPLLSLTLRSTRQLCVVTSEGERKDTRKTISLQPS